MLTAGNEKEVRVIGEKTIIPLVRLGLLILTENDGPTLIVSQLGKATWEQFLDRGGRYPEDLTMSDAIVSG